MAQRRFGPWHEVPRQREAGLQRSLEFHRGRGKVGGVATVLVATRGLLNFLRGEKKTSSGSSTEGQKEKPKWEGKRGIENSRPGDNKHTVKGNGKARHNFGKTQESVLSRYGAEWRAVVEDQREKAGQVFLKADKSECDLEHHAEPWTSLSWRVWKGSHV